MIAATLVVALVFAFVIRERPQQPVSNSSGPLEYSGPVSVVEPTDTTGLASEAVVDEPVNPVFGRSGVPASDTAQLTPEELAKISSGNEVSGIQTSARESTHREPQLTNLVGPDVSATGDIGLSPEASDPGITGPAPEAVVTQIPGPAPEAGVLQIPGLAPEAGMPNIPGPAPEVSDPGSMGSAPEAGDVGPGGQPPGTNGPPPEGY